MLSLEQKQAIVAEVAEVAKTAQSVIAAEYRGLTVEQITQLRKDARNVGVYVRVVKNTLARRALEGTGYECMGDDLKGPLVLAFSTQDASSAAKVLSEFAKNNEKFAVKVVALSGKLLKPGDIESLAKMPTRDQAISMLMGVMKAPIEKFVRTLAEPNNKLARTIAAIRDKKQAG